MVKSLNPRRCLLLGLLSLGSLLSVGPQVSAQTVEPGTSPEGTDLGQSSEIVLPFTDVPPDHWAYQALLNLAGTYGCVSGYPDGTFRGEAAITRYEFAAGLDACLGALIPLMEQQGNQQQEIDALIESMEQSLDELRDLDQEVQDRQAEDF